MAMRHLRASSALDRIFYQLQIDGSVWERMDPVRHYVLFGATEGLDPNSAFSTKFYMGAHEDVASAGINPLYHFLRYGRGEGRRIEPSEKAEEILNRLLGDSAGQIDIGLGRFSPEDYRTYPWPARIEGATEEAGPFDIRPDDDVLAEGHAGSKFSSRFELNSSSPLFRDAARALPTGAVDPAVEAIDVSIIIPVYGQLAQTLNCLDALLCHKSRYRFEVIIGDDASPDETESVLREVRAVRYIRYPINRGFISNCNKTAKRAKGRFLVFLNNDTRVCEGWLDALIDSFDIFPDAGLVGSKLFYPDGSLQEAGGIVWRDGSAWNYGRNDDPNRPRYCHARDVDYVSGASIAILRKLWETLEGFDSHYLPAYYEDTDLAFRVRAMGHRVIMQPGSRIIHYEGKSSGTDTSIGTKAYQVANHKKFFARWRETLKGHRPAGSQPWAERERNVQRRVLVLDEVNPTPGEDAGSLATFNLIRMYQALGYKVTFLPEDNFLYERKKVQLLQSMGVECLYAPYETSLRSHLSRVGSLYDVVQLIRPDVAYKHLETVRSLAPRSRVVFLNADLYSLRLSRQADIEKNEDLRVAAQVYRDKEIHLARNCDTVLVHSTTEREILYQEVAEANVEVMPLIERAVHTEVNYASRTDIMFLGGYNHPPNVDAANWLIDEIWPLLSKAIPEARLLLVGSNPPEALKQRATDTIVVTGTVPNLSPWFEKARVFIAPLRYGAGAKGKVLAALANGVPVVATSVAAEGMPFENGRNIFIAEKADLLARLTLDLYCRSEADWCRLSSAARAYIDTEHSFEKGLCVLSRVLSS